MSRKDCRKDCHAGGSDLVRGIPVCRHPVTAHEYGVHPAVFHDRGGHVVTDEGYVHAGGGKLKGGQSGSLQQGTGFIRKHMKAVTLLLPQINGSRGGAVTDGGQLARVAVRENAVPFFYQRQAVFPNPSAYPDILVADLLRLLFQKGQDLRHRKGSVIRHHPLHPLQRPGEIHRRGT